MANPQVAGYAEALFAVAAAEGNLAVVEDELFGFAQAIRSNDELRSTLADGNVPAGHSNYVSVGIPRGRSRPRRRPPRHRGCLY